MNVNKLLKIIKPLIVPALLLGLLGFGLAVTAGLGYHWYQTGRKPDQPIAYSHYLHVEKNGLECTDCHQNADKGPQATVPAMQICMDCHEDVAADRRSIKKLKKYWENKEPIPWNKVHNTPWHVHFTHKRHIKAEIECTYCHGQVKAMTTNRQTRSLDMGWCVTCHKENNAPTDCLTCHK